ncbi:hypothetical protein [Desulfosudis oleivorans]|uniref:hypothetical protein n=1 Tax=Desulfosudis oleivorans TaxID=181663 RepID=UPI00059CCF7B|nr:hypothetical protein [Desulfosudis oleivorans]
MVSKIVPKRTFTLYNHLNLKIAGIRLKTKLSLEKQIFYTPRRGINGRPRPLQRSRAQMLFSEKAGKLFEHREAGEFLPAPKKAFVRGKPKAKLHGPVLLVLFLPPRKVHG